MQALEQGITVCVGAVTTLIYVANGGFAQKISIQPIYIGNDFFTIASHRLDGTEQVITDGAAYLKDGMAIRVVE